MKITMQAIADLAGVSRATVDKVIHNRPGVSDSVREQIKAIILETNYKPTQIRKFMQEESKPLRIAIIIPDLQDPFMKHVKSGMDAACLEYHSSGLTVDYYYRTGYDPEQVIAILNHLKKSSVNGIALHGLCTQPIIEQIEALSQQGIPVFTYDADLPTSKRICFIGEEPYRTGQIAASLLCKSIGHQGQIALLTGSENLNTCHERLMGFFSYLENFAPEVQVVTVEETLGQHHLTYQKTLEILQQYSDIKGIWNSICHSEDMAQAVVDAGRQGTVKLISMLFTPEVIRFIKSGVIDFTIGLTPYKLGKTTIKSLYEYLISNIAPSPPTIWTPVYIGCDANIDTFENQL